MTIFLNRGGKSPHFANVSASIAYYLTPQKRAAIQRVIEEAIANRTNDDGADETVGALRDLHEFFTNETITAWGATPDYEAEFNDISAGDWFLIRTGYHNLTDRYIRFAQHIDRTVGTDIPESVRVDISEQIWGSQRFTLSWFSETLVWEFETSEGDFEPIVHEAEPGWSFQDWFAGQSDNFKLIPDAWIEAQGGEEAFMQAVRGPDASQRTRDIDHYRIICVGDAGEEVYWESDDPTRPGPQYLAETDVGFGTPLKSLRDVRNDAAVLFYDGDAIIGQGLLGYVGSDDRQDVSGTSAAIIDYSDFEPPIEYSDLSAPFQQLLDDADGDILSVKRGVFDGLAQLHWLEPPTATDIKRLPQSEVPGESRSSSVGDTDDPGQDASTTPEDETDLTARDRPKRGDTIRRQLEQTNQVVFHGPPGKGKTYTAKQFAYWWLHETTAGTPTSSQLEVVTFHPSFTYEDFIEGLTAREVNGSVEYSVQAGVFKQMCTRAREAYEAASSPEAAPPYLLIIDEINRGNLAQIFGETITLLETDKRIDAASETATTLPHSKAPFRVPPNLYIIGTMNTADRSIALVDAALRRRFRFIPFTPDPETLYDIYGFADYDDVRQTIATDDDPGRVLLALSIAAVRSLNQQIVNTTDLSKGQQIGHSYLIGLPESGPDDQIQWLVDVWQFEILPLLEEYLFGQFDRIQTDLFQGTGESLFDTTQEEIAMFDAADLADALADLTGVDPSSEVRTTLADHGDTSAAGDGSDAPDSGDGDVTVAPDTEAED